MLHIDVGWMAEGRALMGDSDVGERFSRLQSRKTARKESGRNQPVRLC